MTLAAAALLISITGRFSRRSGIHLRNLGPIYGTSQPHLFEVYVNSRQEGI